MLLAAFAAHRATRDVDLHARAIANDADTTLALLRSVAAIDLEDGLNFHPEPTRADVIRDDDAYSGVRVTLEFSLARAVITFHVDVSVGDPVIPDPGQVRIPRLLGGDVLLLGYPLVMVLAEKIVTALERGIANTRWRDFGDVYVLVRHHDLDGSDLVKALVAVTDHRGVVLRSLSEVLAGFADAAQTRYATWRRKNARLELPEDFGVLLEQVVAFSDGALSDQATSSRWVASRLRWTFEAR